MATPLQSALARDAWASFQSLPSPADEPRACHPPHPFRNATVDMRNLSSVTRVQFFAKLRKRWRCESPSEKQHLVRLQQAAAARGRTLTLVQIGANAGGTGKSREANEWIGDLVRRYKWRAALVEPVPFLFERLRENYAREITAGQVSVHQLVVHANRTAVGTDGKCPFRAVNASCMRVAASGEVAIDSTRCPRVSSNLLQTGRIEAAADVSEASRYWIDHQNARMVPLRLPCVHIGALFRRLGLTSGDVDILVLDTEGFDFALMRALDLRAVRPLALEYETKAFTLSQLDEIQTKLETYGYRVFDANASPDAPHWQSKWQVIETFAVQTGESAPPQFVPGGLDCARTVGVMCECSTPTRCIWKVRSRLDLENL